MMENFIVQNTQNVVSRRNNISKDETCSDCSTKNFDKQSNIVLMKNEITSNHRQLIDHDRKSERSSIHVRTFPS